MARLTVADWLEALEHAGVATIDPDIAIDAERLLAAWATDGKVAVEDAADALAARVATSAEQYRAVRQSFVEALGQEVGHGGERASDTDGGGTGERRPGEGLPGEEGKRGHAWWWVGAAGLAAMGVGWWWWTQQPPEPSQPPPPPPDEAPAETTEADTSSSDDTTTTASSDDTDTTTTSDSGGETSVEVEEEHEVPLYGSPWSPSSLATMLGAGLAAALLVILGLRWLVAKTQRDGQQARALAAIEEAVEREGAETAELYRWKAPPPLDPTTIDAAADLLGRPGHDEQGTRLDVPRTLDRTVRAGGQPRPRFLRASRQPPLVVLVDVEEWGPAGQAYPLAHAVEWILERWQRTGLRFARFDYVGNLPGEVRRPGSARVIGMRALARRHGGARLLVWSRLKRLRGAPLATWLAALRPWERRAWIDLDPRPAVPVVAGEDGRVAAALERLAEVERAGLARYPLTRQGLVAAARHVVVERGRPPAVTDEVVLRPGDAAQRARIEQALAQWAAAACCVPDPAWPHLDVLRTLLPDVRRVIPEARGVWWLLRWLEREACLEGKATEARNKLALRDGAEVRLLKDEQPITVDGRASTVEQWITQRLVQQLHDGAAASSGATRRIDEEERQARLAYYQCGWDLAGGVEALGKLLGTTADPLVRELLGRLGHRIDAGALPGVSEGKEAGARVKVALGERVSAREVMRQMPLRWEVAAAAGVLGGVMTVMLGMRRDEVIGVRVEPAVYEVRLPEAKVREPDGEDDAEPTADVPAVARPRPLPETETVALELPAGARAMRLLRIPAGAFWMGSPETEADRESDEQRHRVTMTWPFMMCETEVTQGQWKAVMGENPSSRGYGYGDDVAVHDVSWLMAVEFLNALSRKQGLAECYSKAGEEWTWDRACEGYRLPTEAEWEYAARAGTETAYSFGNDAARLDEHAWYSGNSNTQAHPVAKKNPNDRGLYDVHGNVWEWAWDWYESDYGSQAKTDPSGPKTGDGRVLRGGAFGNYAQVLRSANRSGYFPNYGDRSSGLRCVRGPHPSRADVP
jgi:formylglycine-generating enzyme required for sulfatase activity